MAEAVNIILETIFGPTLTLSTGRIIPTRWVGEQHVQQDPIRPLPWMGRAGRLEDRPAAEAAAPKVRERPRTG
jgi:hypothetical protein